MRPEDLQSALDDVSASLSSNVVDRLWFLLEQALKSTIESLYDNEGLIRAAAAAKKSEQEKVKLRLKAKFGQDLSITTWNSLVRESKAALESVELEGEPLGLIKGGNGATLLGFENATIFIKKSPEWQGVIALNEFTGGVEVRIPPPVPVRNIPGTEIDDNFDTQTTRWLERRSHLMFRRETVHAVVNDIADENRFHPVRDYLASLPAWDGVERISNWLFWYCGVDRGSDERPSIADVMGRKFLISMIARVMKPGCQADHMLVLEGKTGIGKSSIARALCADPEWFTDQIADIGSQNASMSVRGVWVVEFADLDKFSRADENEAKRFISQRFDRFRLPYGKRIAKFPRQCVFIGTTESSDWNKSETARRQWPVACGKVDLAGLVRRRDSLWAEALAAYNDHEPWHLSGEDEVAEAAVEQKKRYSGDPWREKVIERANQIVDDPESRSPVGWVTTGMVLDKIGIPMSQWDDRSKKRIGVILRAEGWKASQKRWPGGSGPASGFQRG
jgi:putative DNA primase/helicase